MQGLDFDDVLLVPKNSEVNSRENVDISFKSKFLNLELPVIASPMANIVDNNFAIKLAELGGLAILHRFKASHERFEDIDVVSRETENFGVSIGLTENDLDIVQYAVERRTRIICVDVANGYTKNLKEFILNKVKPILNQSSTLLMSGNVATSEGFNDLSDYGCNLIRVGIGSGALCTTRNKTGIGVPQLTAIKDCFLNGENRYSYLVADGGIRNSGDAVKALAFGADLVMLGSLFATTKESAHNGLIYGMASKEMQEQFYGRSKSIEGLAKEVEKLMSLEDFINDFKYSLKSACTYLNINNINRIKLTPYIETGKGSIKQWNY